MGTVITIIAIAVLIGAIVVLLKQRGAGKQQQLDDAKAEARRWLERLGGQVINLTATNDAAKQALADASERYTAAGSQMEQARTKEQCQLVTQTAMEGLYYVRAARIAMDMDPGPELPDLTGQRNAGQVSEDRKVTVEGHEYEASAQPSETTPHYYPGGMVAGRPVPQGWYSEPWWKTALVAGAWGVGSMLLFDAMFSGMHSVPYAGGWDQGYFDQGNYGDQAMLASDTNDQGNWDNGNWDSNGFDGNGFDNGGFDGGGFDSSNDW